MFSGRRKPSWTTHTGKIGPVKSLEYPRKTEGQFNPTKESKKFGRDDILKISYVSATD